jgi:hypothetical protein
MKKIFLLFYLCFSVQVFAVSISYKGLGDAAIIPYYTVNNNLNTLVSVTNTTDQGKAIKINIREGLHGYATLSYNVYLNGYDTWTFALVPTESSIAGYAGQDSASHITTDQSCAPFLNKSGQEFLPFELNDGPNDLQRTREGFIEIIEMGSINVETNAYANAYHGTNGIPAGCFFFEESWQENGQWHEQSGGNPLAEFSPSSGGIMTEAQIIDVTEGINYSIPVITLEGFHADDTITHTNPGDTSLSLDSAEPTARIYTNNRTYQLAFDSGIDAVSAVLMSDKLIATYAIDSYIDGKSETIYTQPTRRFYTTFNDSDATAPFNSDTLVMNCPASNYGGVEIFQLILDREAQQEILSGCPKTSPCPPASAPDAVCGSVFVQGFVTPSHIGNLPDTPYITASKNSLISSSPAIAHATESGFFTTGFINTRPLTGTDVNTDATVEINGLPIIGVSLQRYTNAGAGQGLLAQYGGAQLVKSTVNIEEVENEGNK